MELQAGERVIKIYHHHPFPFIMQLIKTVGVSIPFFALIYLVSFAIPFQYTIIGILLISGLFTLIITYLALIYWLDKLVITNKRIVHIDWKVLTKRDEAEALVNDIQDIHTQEKGFLSVVYIFDYGVLRLETASSKTTITFTEAPDPEGIKEYISKVIKQSRKKSPHTSAVRPVERAAAAASEI